MDITSVPFLVIFDMPISEIRPAPFNPPVRTQESTLRILLNQIREFGVLDPIKLSRDGILGDGHRRVKCAKIIGLTTIPARRYDMSVEELWALNFGGRPSSPKETFVAVVSGMPDTYTPKSRKNAINKIYSLVGEDGAKEVVRRGYSSHIVSVAVQVANYCDRGEDHEFIRRTLIWLMNNEQQQMARAAMRLGIPPERLETTIEENRSLVYQWQ